MGITKLLFLLLMVLCTFIGIIMYKRPLLAMIGAVFIGIFAAFLLNSIEPKNVEQKPINYIYKYEIQGNDTILVDSTETSERGYKVYYY